MERSVLVHYEYQQLQNKGMLQLKKEDLEDLIEEHPVLLQEIEDKISNYS